MRSIMGTLIVTVLLATLVLPAVAQTADISLGGGLVARLRDPGSFKTVEERAASVDKMLIEVISKEDTQHPQVMAKQKGNLWTVYAWDRPIMTVYPAEAKVNQMTEKQLALQWANSLRTQLPKATPCSKLPPEQLGYGKKPAAAPATPTAVAAKPATAAPPAKPSAAAAKPVAVTAAKPVSARPVAQVTPTAIPARPASTMTGGESGAMLLIVDALRAAREMNDQDWAAKKESMARGLYGDLSYYLTGKGVAPKPPAAKPVVVPVKPATVKPAVAKPPVTTPAKPATKPTAVIKPAATTTPAADASTAKVPQKNRIRAKFAAAKAPLDSLKATDAQAAAAINKLLADSRQAFAYGKFDESEQQVDAALAALGVTFKE